MPKDWKKAFWSKVDKTGKCWLWLGHKDKDGYGVFGGSSVKEGDGRGRETGGEWRVHRIAFVLLNGFIEDDDYIMHSCNNPSCVHPLHLLKGTPKENSQYREQCGRHPHLRTTYKVTFESAKELRRLYATGKYTMEALGKRFGISRSHAENVINGYNGVYKKWGRTLRLFKRGGPHGPKIGKGIAAKVTKALMDGK